MTSDTEPDDYQCGYCQDTFDSQNSMENHIRHFHSEKVNESDISTENESCDEEVNVLKDLIVVQTESIIDTFECFPCEQTFKSEEDLARHIQEVHDKESSDKSSSKSRPRNYKCSSCQKSFYTNSDLWSHERIHSGSKYTCHLCGKKLASSGSLHNHLKSVHDQEKQFECQICQKKFALKQKLSTHELVEHQGQKPFQCNQCDKGFVHKQSFEAHLRKHNGTVLNCELCSKPFHDAGYLRKHLRWHKKVQDLRNN